jgi:Ser/Thr protein kinase RdoA (MazF antagonist)
MVWAADGAMGRVWRLETDTGTYAVKESLRPEDPVRFLAQLEFAAAVSEHVRQAGIHVPEVLRTRTGSLTLTVHDDQRRDARVARVATWITGTTAVDTSTAAAWLGTTLATIEAIPDPPAVPESDPWLEAWFTRVPSPAQWMELVERAEQVGAQWSRLLVGHLPGFADLGALVGPPGGPLSVAHTDLQPKNVLTTHDGYALLDWDDVARAAPDRSLARAIADWHLHAGVIDVEAVHRTLAAYRAGGGSGNMRHLDAFGDFAAGFLNYLHEQLNASLDEVLPEATASPTLGPVAMAMLRDPVDVGALRRLSVLDQTRPE